MALLVILILLCSCTFILLLIHHSSGCTSTDKRDISIRSDALDLQTRLIEGKGTSSEQKQTCSCSISTSKEFIALARSLSASVSRESGCESRFSVNNSALPVSHSFCVFKSSSTNSVVPDTYSLEEICSRVTTKTRGVQNFLFSRASGEHLEKLASICRVPPDNLKLTAFIEDIDVMVNLVRGEDNAICILPSSQEDYSHLTKQDMLEVRTNGRSCAVFEAPDFGDMTMRIHSMSFSQRQTVLDTLKEHIDSLEESSKPRSLLITIE